MKHNTPSLKICVIGAGLSGLVSIKEFREESHEVVCYEKSINPGGVFSYNRNKSASYDDLLLTVSNYFMAFSSLTPPESEERRYWSQGEYYSYLERFIETYNLLDHIVFEADVMDLHRQEDGRWEVSVMVDGTLQKNIFDAVAVCTGKFRAPFIPKLEGLDSFKGVIQHTIDYNNAQFFKGKKVVCIGMGESGADVCHQIAQVAESTTVVVRRPPYIVPRNIRMFTERDDTNDAITSPFLYSLFNFNIHPNTAVRFCFERLARARSASIKESAAKLIFDWGDMSGGAVGQFFTKNDIFINDIIEERLRFNLFGIERIEDNYVVCKDGTEIEADALMFCTGYRDDFALFSNVEEIRQAEQNVRKLYQHMFHPKIGPSLAFLGFSRPAAGGVPLCAELQARYLARVYSGKIASPNRIELERQTKMAEEKERSHYFIQPHISELIIYYDYIKGLAKKIGCFPNTWLFLLDPVLLLKYYFGSTVPNYFRLSGPGKRTKEAKAVIKKLKFGFSFKSVVAISLFKLMLHIVYITDRLVLNRLSKKLQSKEEIPLRYLSKEFKDNNIDTNLNVRSLCKNDIQWNNLKYGLYKYCKLDPKTLTETLTVKEIDSLYKEIMPTKRAEAKSMENIAG